MKNTDNYESTTISGENPQSHTHEVNPKEKTMSNTKQVNPKENTMYTYNYNIESILKTTGDDSLLAEYDRLPAELRGNIVPLGADDDWAKRDFTRQDLNVFGTGLAIKTGPTKDGGFILGLEFKECARYSGLAALDGMGMKVEWPHKDSINLLFYIPDNQANCTLLGALMYGLHPNFRKSIDLGKDLCQYRKKLVKSEIVVAFRNTSKVVVTGSYSHSKLKLKGRYSYSGNPSNYDAEALRSFLIKHCDFVNVWCPSRESWEHLVPDYKPTSSQSPKSTSSSQSSKSSSSGGDSGETPSISGVRVSKYNLCPVCGQDHSCKINDNLSVFCWREKGYSHGTSIGDYFFAKDLAGGAMGGLWIHKDNWKSKKNGEKIIRKQKSAEEKVLTALDKKKPFNRSEINEALTKLAKAIGFQGKRKRGVNYLNEKFGVNLKDADWDARGFFSVTSRETTLSVKQPTWIAGMVATRNAKTSILFKSSWGAAVGIPIRDIDGNIIGYKFKNFSEKAPKYTWPSYKYEEQGKERIVNNYRLRVSETKVEAPMQVALAAPDDKTVYYCEGYLKPLVASLKHGINVIGCDFGLYSVETQLVETLRRFDKVVITPDAGTFANNNVLARLQNDIEFLNKVKAEHKLICEVVIADWGQLWDKTGGGDIDEISSEKVGSWNIYTASVLEKIVPLEVRSNAPTTIIYSNECVSGGQKWNILKGKPLSDRFSASHFCFRDYSQLVKRVEEAAEQHDLIRRFISKEKLTPAECAVIATSLAHSDYGEKFYREHLHADYDTDKGSTNNVKEFRTIAHLSGYQPCQLPGSSHSLYDYLRASVIIRYKQPKTVIVKQAESELEESMRAALASQDNKVHVIKIDAGVGKTHWLTQNNPNAIIALKTHALIEEFVEKCAYPVLKQVQLCLPPVINYIVQDLYRFNRGYVANAFLYECTAHEFCFSKMKRKYQLNLMPNRDNILEELTPEVKRHIHQVLENKRLIKSGEYEGTILMTHSLYSMYSADLAGRTVIFDECPIHAYIGTNSATLESLSVVSNMYRTSHGVELPLDTILNKLLAAKDGEVIEVFNEVEKIDVLQFITAYNHPKLIDKERTVAPILKASYVTKNGNKFEIIEHKPPFPDGKIIILSATPNIPLIKKLAGDRISIVDCGTVELQGNILQVADKSYSRSSIKDADIDELVELCGDLPVITFLKEKSKFKNADKVNHFGNCLGHNNLKGKSIAVVGYNQPSPSTMIAMFVAAGGDMTDKDTRFKNQIVCYNGFRFKFYCFVDEELRELQFSLINDSVEQAQARARLIRNDVNAIVFAGFPLKQATIISKEQVKELNEKGTAEEVASNGIEESDTGNAETLSEPSSVLDETACSEAQSSQTACSVECDSIDSTIERDSEREQETKRNGETAVENCLRTCPQEVRDAIQVFTIPFTIETFREYCIENYPNVNSTEELLEIAKDYVEIHDIPF